jgi:pyruvate,water dikinase
MMCEVPSNAILAEQFLQFFDGFSIGSNDLTQLTLGLDRDSGWRTAGRTTSTSATRPSRR